ncbi:alpha-methylacyl-CoA racemase [Hoeflea marina]|uniref:Alpha-methylacyl-CoA racemase n=1 Tax=Hoeflea marina TaxID=274592 RepID=A0A317PQQ8_9HYPH|nr:CaiB/BaiF CoA-transferase family protein [Hoeflea marina]PWW03828.1 alpha-methylacyl-CoA racemase [Hoeflea marina]
MGPLEGIRVVEFDAIGPVPLCAMLLADMGADIVRIARPGGQAAFEDLGEAILHRGRAGVELDLKQAADREAALALVEMADIVIEGFRPGVMERLGLGPDVCLARNPALVYGRMTGWGQSGPLSPRAGHDINYLAISGALGAIGEAGGAPVPPLNLVADYGGGAMFLLAGVLAAQISSRRTGHGQVVDAAMSDGVPVLMSLFHALRQSGGWREERGSNLLDGGAPFYRCYSCAGGGHVAVGALEPQFFARLVAGLGLDPGRYRQHDRAGWPAMEADFAGAFLSRGRDDWAAAFAGSDACVTPVLSMAEAAEHPHNSARASFVRGPAPGPEQGADAESGPGDVTGRQSHAETSEGPDGEPGDESGRAAAGGLLQPAPAPRFGRTPSAIRPQSAATAAEMLSRWRSPPAADDGRDPD